MITINHHHYLHCDGQEQIIAFLRQLVTKGTTMARTMDEVLDQVGKVADAVNSLEAKVTEALKNSGIDAATQAKIDKAFDDLGSIVADAADGVDEAAVAPVVVNPV